MLLGKAEFTLSAPSLPAFIVEEFLRYVIGNLIDHHDEVVVTQAHSARKVTFTIRLPDSEIGKVIGRQGRTIEAVRNLVSAAATKQGLKAVVQIES